MLRVSSNKIHRQFHLIKPQDQGELDLLEIDRMNAEEAFLDRHPQSAFDLTTCCSSNGRH
jgi:hypothetical protein